LALVLRSDAVIGSQPIWSRGAQPRSKQFNNDETTNKTNKSSLPGPSLDQEEKATEPGAGKPKVKYSGAARWFKKEQRKLGAEQAQGTSASELGIEGGGSKAQGNQESLPTGTLETLGKKQGVQDGQGDHAQAVDKNGDAINFHVIV
ncbi:hypothetical protein PV326_006686, partial [Microctonus aethiopoides]